MFRLFFLFIIIMLLSNFFLLSFFEVKEDFLLPIFLVILIIVVSDYRLAVIMGIIFAIIGEIVSGLHLGSIVISFLFTFLAYIWASRFFNIKAVKFYPEGSVIEFILEIVSAVSMMYLFSIFNFFSEKIFYSRGLSWHQWLLIFYNPRAITIICIEAVVVLLILKYFKVKKSIIIPSGYVQI